MNQSAHIPAIFEAVTCRQLNYQKSNEWVIVPGEITHYSEHVRAAINELLNVFQDARNGDIVRQVHAICNEEDLQNFINEAEQVDEGNHDQISLVNMESYENLLDEHTITNYDNLNENIRGLLQQLEESINNEDDEIDLEESFDDIRLCDVEYSDSVKDLIKSLTEESDQTIAYAYIFDNFIKRNVVDHLDKFVGSKKSRSAIKIMVFWATPRQMAKDGPNIIVKTLFHETGKNTKISQFSFGVKAYQSENTFNTVQEILNGNLKIN